MEDINIILSFIDEYNEKFKDNDYKNVMNALRRMYYYNKKVMNMIYLKVKIMKKYRKVFYGIAHHMIL
jgi:hypothetical protein